MHFIIGLAVMAAGFSFVYKTEWYVNNFGRVEFFEQHLGAGGSRLGYKLLGIALMFIGFMIFTNIINDFLLWILGPLLRHSVPISQ